MTGRTIPCARPKVTVQTHLRDPDGHMVVCQVPGCGWQYPEDLQYIALASDAQAQATVHRWEHKQLVPATKIVRDPEWDVHCTPCGGHRRTFGTKREAQTWLAAHLADEHGVVTS